MSAEERFARCMATKAAPSPLTSDDKLHWDGRSLASPANVLTQRSDLLTQTTLAQEQSASAFDWAREAASLTFYLNPRLLTGSLDNIIHRVTGTLQWVQRVEHAEIDILAVHPALHVQTAYTLLPAEWVELVPHLPVYDPLLKHMALVLQAEVEAEGMADWLYAESLAEALAIHFLKRYAACRPPVRALARGLAPYKLRRTTTYIQEHLDHQLSLIELAAVSQTSPKHFARLFKQVTGKTLHQYVLSCRIDRAKQLLADTTLSLSEVSYQVGCTDQSHLTALFRKYVGMTPKAYRDATHGE